MTVFKHNMKGVFLTALAISLGHVAISSDVMAQLGPNQEIAIYTGGQKLNTVNIIDKNLQHTYELKRGGTHTSGKLAVEATQLRKGPTGLPEMLVQLRNLTDFPQAILVRTTWYDEQDFPVDGPSAWTRLHVAQNGGSIYRTSSINFDAQQFYVEIQEVR